MRRPVTQRKHAETSNRAIQTTKNRWLSDERRHRVQWTYTHLGENVDKLKLLITNLSVDCQFVGTPSASPEVSRLLAKAVQTWIQEDSYHLVTFVQPGRHCCELLAWLEEISRWMAVLLAECCFDAVACPDLAAALGQPDTAPTAIAELLDREPMQIAVANKIPIPRYAAICENHPYRTRARHTRIESAYPEVSLLLAQALLEVVKQNWSQWYLGSECEAPLRTLGGWLRRAAHLLSSVFNSCHFSIPEHCCDEITETVNSIVSLRDTLAKLLLLPPKEAESSSTSDSEPWSGLHCLVRAAGISEHEVNTVVNRLIFETVSLDIDTIWKRHEKAGDLELWILKKWSLLKPAMIRETSITKRKTSPAKRKTSSAKKEASLSSSDDSSSSGRESVVASRPIRLNELHQGVITLEMQQEQIVKSVPLCEYEEAELLCVSYVNLRKCYQELRRAGYLPFPSTGYAHPIDTPSDKIVCELVAHGDFQVVLLSVSKNYDYQLLSLIFKGYDPSDPEKLQQRRAIVLFPQKNNNNFCAKLFVPIYFPEPYKVFVPLRHAKPDIFRRFWDSAESKPSEAEMSNWILANLPKFKPKYQSAWKALAEELRRRCTSL